MAAKRSPILGYNHNVRYRGLIFHVQTEDSGLLSPHLFTHLFHGGVILSSRKLVYDAGAAEDAIKGLMQAQHKVVLKDLKSGKFDEKIDEYLGGTEGLLPSAAALSAARESASEMVAASEAISAAPENASEGAPEGGTPEDGTPEEMPDAATEAVAMPSGLELPRASEPALQVRMSEPEIEIFRPATEPVLDRADTEPPARPRSQTLDRGSPPSKPRPSQPPPPADLDPATEIDVGAQVAAAIAVANATANATVKTTMPPEMEASSLDLLKLDLELEPSDATTARKRPRDTEVSSPSDGVPSSIGGSPSSRIGGDSIPPLPPPPDRRTGDRSALGAATLPPARPVTRPQKQAMSAPSVVSRPLSTEDSDAVEVYAAAPPSAELPPGAASERPGTYAQHKRVSQRIDVLLPERGNTGAVPIPSGLGRPSRSSQSPGSGGIPHRVHREPSSSTPTRASTPSSPVPTRPATPSSPVPTRASTPPPVPTRASTPPPVRAPTSPDSDRLAGRPPERARRQTPARVSATGPTSASGSGGVVMTRPAVIVGAPSQPAPSRVRKAREDEARGFGQGLISEKSLDEVILAYLSEDTEDK